MSKILLSNNRLLLCNSKLPDIVLITVPDQTDQEVADSGDTDSEPRE